MRRPQDVEQAESLAPRFFFMYPSERVSVGHQLLIMAIDINKYCENTFNTLILALGDIKQKGSRKEFQSAATELFLGSMIYITSSAPLGKMDDLIIKAWSLKMAETAGEWYDKNIGSTSKKCGSKTSNYETDDFMDNDDDDDFDFDEDDEDDWNEDEEEDLDDEEEEYDFDDDDDY